MKKLFILLASFAFAMTSCDVIEGPYVEGSFEAPDTTAKVKKILLEDYTGISCSACPKAAEKAEQVMHQFPGRIVTVAVHAGFFAAPKNAPYNNDYRNPTSEAWDTFFGVSAIGNPNGMVDRIDFPTSSHVKGHDSWASISGQIVTEPAEAWIDLSTTYNEGSRQLDITADIQALSSLEGGPYHLFVGLREDSIISAQKSQTETGAPIDVLDYVHMHMMREAVTTTWGDEISAGPMATGATASANYSLSLDAAYVDKNVSVFAFVYDNGTKEVIQAEYDYIK